MTCSYNTSFLARLLIIMDGDVESNPGPNDIDFSIKEQDNQKNMASKEDLQKRSQVWFPAS